MQLAGHDTLAVEKTGDPYKAEMEECLDIIMEEPGKK